MDRNRKAAGPQGTSAGTATVPGLAVTSSRVSNRRRPAMLGTVAAAVLLFGYGRTAQAQAIAPPAPPCDNVVGATVTCTGNLQPGVSIDQVGGPPDTYDRLIVNGLTQNIAPVTNDHGIFFGSDGPVTINSDTTDGPGGPFEIITINSYSGIFALSLTSTASVTSTGDIRQSGFGGFAIRVAADDDAYLRQTGDLTSTGNVGVVVTSAKGEAEVISDGVINAQISGIVVVGNQAASVTSTGNVTANTGNAIDSRSAGDAAIRSYGNVDGGSGGLIVVAGGAGDAYVKSEGSVASRGTFEGIFAGAGAGNTRVMSTGNINAAVSYGIRAQSTNGETRVTSTGNIDAGRDGIRAFAGAEVDVTSTGNIEADEHGIRATGFEATITSTGNIDAAIDGINAAARSTTAITSTGNIDAGRDGISATGGAVTVTSHGDITADGDGIDAVAAFGSIGDTTVTSTGDITSTNGNGIYAASFGGTTAVTSAGNIESYGPGIRARSFFGAVNVRHAGNITTRGDFSDAILAVSDNGNTIAITQSGDISVTGFGSDAINTIQPNGIGTSVVTIERGSIIGGPGGAGVDLDGGLTNRVINFGSISTLGENAIEGDDDASDTVDNYGAVTGNIDLGASADRFNNKSGGLFNTGTNVFLGAGDLLHNAGTVSPGGTFSLRTTALTGNLVQTAGGIFAVDLDLAAAKTDRLNVTGTAQLNGTVAVTPKNPAALTQQFVILSADGGVTNNGLALGPVSPILQAELLFPNANDVVLGIDVDFVIDGLNRNQTAIAKTLNAILDAGGGTLGSVFNGFLNVFTLNGVRSAIDQLSPEIYADTEIAAFYSSFDFSDTLLSCKVNGATTASINTEGQCLWVGAKGRDLQGDNTFEYVGFEESAVQFAGGAQFALNPVWRLGFGAGYQASTLTTDSNDSSNGDQLQGGVSLKYNPGALLVSGTISGGRGWYDTMRSMAFGGFAATAQSDHEIDILQGRLNASYVMGSPSFYYKPILDAAVTDIGFDAIRERGGGGAGLFVHGGNHTVFSLSPALEIGTEWWWDNGTLVRPFLRGGLTWYSEDDLTVRASFSGAPAGVPSFAVTAASDDVQADVAAGVEMISAEDSNLRLFYDGHFGDRLAVHAAGFKASVKF